MHPDKPDTPEDGPDCIDCGATTDLWARTLDEDTGERTTVIDCPDCDFGLETESNHAHADRQDRLAEALDADLTVRDIR